MQRRTLVGFLGAMAVSAAVFGSAASLGGITSPDLGADDTVVASCDTDGVGINYTKSYDPTAPNGYKVTAVTVTGVDDACDGQDVSVTLADSSDASIGDGTYTIPTSVAVNHTVALSTSALAELVEGAHVVISA